MNECTSHYLKYFFFLRGKTQDAFGVQSSEKTAVSEGLGNSLTSVIRK